MNKFQEQGNRNMRRGLRKRKRGNCSLMRRDKPKSVCVWECVWYWCPYVGQLAGEREEAWMEIRKTLSQPCSIFWWWFVFLSLKVFCWHQRWDGEKCRGIPRSRNKTKKREVMSTWGESHEYNKQLDESYGWHAGNTDGEVQTDSAKKVWTCLCTFGLAFLRPLSSSKESFKETVQHWWQKAKHRVPTPYFSV